jgi:hypothetical protein
MWRMAAAVSLACLLSAPALAEGPTVGAGVSASVPALRTADACIACHNGLVTARGEDVSMGFAWRPSMMANSARDPYWQAAVRRELLDHPSAAAEIEHECSACHMPMAHVRAKAAGRKGEVFANLPIGRSAAPDAALAADGASCTMCHLIEDEGLGTEASFTAGFVVRGAGDPAGGRVYGPYDVDAGRTRVMASASGFRPARAAHLRGSELCATCHTLYTHALGPDGKAVGRLPEQVPYLEWRHSAYREEKTCQACHMPPVGNTSISAVLGEPKEHVARHTFRGANFFMPRVLNRYRGELGATALPQELEASARDALEQLRRASASMTIDARLEGGRLVADVAIENLAGHKLPTAYPSRRAWLHLTVKASDAAVVFESGRVGADGAIGGNVNDMDATRFEPHYTVIDRAGQVQIYEAIMVDHRDEVTTGLISAVRFVKDNRLLPRGFDKRTAHADVAVHGEAAHDDDFKAGGDRVRYVVDVGEVRGPFTIEAALRYQPVAYRWARNLARYDAPEIARFVSCFDGMASGSTADIATAAVTVHRSERAGRARSSTTPASTR